MARLLPQPKKIPISKAEAKGKALAILAEKGEVTIPNAALGWGLHKYTVVEYIEKGLIQTIKIGSREKVFAPEFYRILGLLEEHGSLAKAFKAVTEEERQYHDSCS